MVDRPGIIVPEIAATYDRSVNTVRDWIKDAEWPSPTGRRGRFWEYDRAAVDELVRARFARSRPTEAGDPDRLLTMAEAADRAGVKPGTIRADLSRGRWPAPDEIRDGVKMWRASTVDAVLADRQAYRKTGGDSAS